MFNKAELTQLFPQLKTMEDSGLVYLDSAATSLKLKPAVDKQYEFDLHKTANVHRGAHRLSGEATTAYEQSRDAAAQYLNCSRDQVVFTKGTTDSINLIAEHYKQKLSSNDSILLTEMEHHANLIPWQDVSKNTGAKLIFAKVTSKGELDLDEIEGLLKDNNIKIFSLCHVSNTLGTRNPVSEISKLCRKHNTNLIVDGAQAVTIGRPDLTNLDTDFYTFSGHKIFGAFGVGVLYIKNIKNVHLYQRGGGIVNSVDFKKTDYISGPQKFEAGTPNISGVVGLSEVFKFLERLDFKKVEQHEKSLLQLAETELKKFDGYMPIGTSESRINILSFNFKGINPTDLCELLDEQGFALRAGHHCTQPLLKKMGHSGCARASFSIYNTKEDVNGFTKAVKKALEVLR